MVLKQCGQDAMTFLAPGLVQRLHVLLGQHAEHELVAQPAGGVAGAGLGRAEHREAAPRRCAAARRWPWWCFLARSSSAPAQPTQNRYSMSVGDLPVDHGHLEVQLGDPLQPLVLGHPPRVAPALEVVQHRGGLLRGTRTRPGPGGGASRRCGRCARCRPGIPRRRPRSWCTTRSPPGRSPRSASLRADQRALRLGLDRVREVLPFLLRRQEPGGLGEGVVAQVQDDLLGATAACR